MSAISYVASCELVTVHDCKAGFSSLFSFKDYVLNTCINITDVTILDESVIL